MSPRWQVGLVSLVVAAFAWTAPVAVAMPSDPPPEPVPVGSLPRGTAPAVPYLQGDTIHAGSHRVHVPLPSSAGHHLFLLGPAAGGWVVLSEDARRATVYELKHGHLRTIRAINDRGHDAEFLLGADERHLLEVRNTTRPVAHASAYDLHHRHVRTTKVGDLQSVLGFDGRTAYFLGDEAWSWVPGHPKAHVWPSDIDGVDFDHRILWVEDLTTGGVGPTSLDAPATPPWTAGFTPVAVSPDGQYVSGYLYQDIQIRRMADGSLLRDFEQKFDQLGPYGSWDDGDTVLFSVRQGARRTVVRCPVSGTCEVAIPSTHDPVILAFLPVGT